MKKIFFVFLTMLTLSIRSQTCNVSTVTPDYYYYPGTPYNTSFLAGYVYYLCDNAVVYDTLGSGDFTIMINPGAQFTWKPCAPAYTGIYIKSGGILNIKQQICGTSTQIFVEPGAIVNDPYGAMFTGTTACSSILLPTVNCALSIREKTENNAIIFSPNPTNGITTFEFLDAQIAEESEIKIKTILGQEIRKVPVLDRKQVIDLSNLNNGVYFMEVFQHEKHVATKKIIKQ